MYIILRMYILTCSSSFFCLARSELASDMILRSLASSDLWLSSSFLLCSSSCFLRDTSVPRLSFSCSRWVRSALLLTSARSYTIHRLCQQTSLFIIYVWVYLSSNLFLELVDLVRHDFKLAFHLSDLIPGLNKTLTAHVPFSTHCFV